MADAFAAYLAKPRPPNSSDVIRVGKMNALVGDLPLTEYREAWRQFRAAYLYGHDPAGQDRYRSVLQAAVNVYHEAHGLDPLRIKVIPFSNERIRFLSREDRDRLISSYAPHVQPIATMLAFQGPRTQAG